MGRANGVTTESRGGTVSRRTLLQSGAALATAGYVASAGIGTVSAQSDDPWPAQGFDPENTRHSPNTTPLRSYPAVVAQEDIPASAHADYTLTGGTAFLHSAGNGLGAIDTETGGLMWQVDMGGETIIPEGIDGSNVLARGWTELSMSFRWIAALQWLTSHWTRDTASATTGITSGWRPFLRGALSAARPDLRTSTGKRR